MPVDVQYATDTPAPAAEPIQRWAEAVLRSVGSPPLWAQAPARTGGRPAAADGEVCIRIVGEDEGRRLNREYRHRDTATNVLSFPAGVDLPDALVWGDVVVCAPVVAREAAAQRKQYEDHFAHMVVHGVLHLLGYDHQTDAEAAVMEQQEARILDRFGVSDPYGEG